MSQDTSTKKAGLIPDKLYFKIGEVCKIADVKQHVLRYWETEFKKFIRPQRASSKQRLYRKVDVENILKIKKLLKDEGFTIPGAKKFLLKLKEIPKDSSPTPENQQDILNFMGDIKKELCELKELLQKK